MGLYPATVVRRVNAIKRMMAESYTIEEIQRSFLRFKDEIEAVERGLKELFVGFERELRAPEFDAGRRKQLGKELADARQRGRRPRWPHRGFGAADRIAAGARREGARIFLRRLGGRRGPAVARGCGNEGGAMDDDTRDEIEHGMLAHDGAGDEAADTDELPGQPQDPAEAAHARALEDHRAQAADQGGAALSRAACRCSTIPIGRRRAARARRTCGPARTSPASTTCISTSTRRRAASSSTSPTSRCGRWPRPARSTSPTSGGITLEEVGEILNLTRERIRQVEVRGLLKLKMVGPGEEPLPGDPGYYVDGGR